ncbi:hypothetical protein [Kitasatospora sp. NPDC048538]|uniref:hypothetical protein n=1 Tax=unclassified Kitasatospora TaxID=2633591 RepID=UPI0033C7EC90
MPVPVVRPAPPRDVADRAAVQRLPIAGPAAQPAAPPVPSLSPLAPSSPGAGGRSLPGLPGTGAASAPRQVVWRAPVRGGASGAPGPAAGSQPGVAADTARVLQRVAEHAGLTGVPMTAVPAGSPVVSRSAVPGGPGLPHPGAAAGAQEGSGAQAGGAFGADHLDELARRLIEPVGRLLRAELRRGRERAGRPYDGRR